MFNDHIFWILEIFLRPVKLALPLSSCLLSFMKVFSILLGMVSWNLCGLFFVLLPLFYLLWESKLCFERLRFMVWFNFFSLLPYFLHNYLNKFVDLSLTLLFFKPIFLLLSYYLFYPYFLIDLLWSYFLIDLLWSYFLIDLLWSYFLIDLLWSYFLIDLLPELTVDFFKSENLLGLLIILCLIISVSFCLLANFYLMISKYSSFFNRTFSSTSIKIGYFLIIISFSFQNYLKYPFLNASSALGLFYGLNCSILYTNSNNSLFSFPIFESISVFFIFPPFTWLIITSAN